MYPLMKLCCYTDLFLAAAAEEDDTYREALAIVEKYKKLDLSAENTVSDENNKPKPFNNLSSVYDRIKAETADNSSDKRKISEKKWSSGVDENNNLEPNLNNNDAKPWNSTAWLRQQVPETNYDGAVTGYNGGDYMRNSILNNKSIVFQYCPNNS